MKQLASFTGEQIDPEAMHRLQPIIDDPLFNFEKMATKSVAAAHLCEWVSRLSLALTRSGVPAKAHFTPPSSCQVINMVEFHRVYRRVPPLMDQLASAQEGHAAADAELQAIEGDLRKIDRKLAVYQVEFKHLTESRSQDELEVQAALKRLKLAERLHKGLEDELARWGRQVREAAA
jgi:dynein heavy chain